jgi:hypothetical protein
MKRIGLLIGFLAGVLFLLPLPAQDVKKEAGKTEKKKDEAKKDLDKKDDAKDPEKKDEKKDPEKKKAPEKLVYGVKLVTRIQGFKGETNREYSIDVQEIDQSKVFAFNKWKAERSQQLAQAQFNIQRIDPKDFQGRANAIQDYQRAVAEFQQQSAQRATQLTTAKRMEVRAAENAKVRMMLPPVEFDDTGKQIVWTKKLLAERKDKTGLPGYPADFDAIKQGQLVEVYMAKVAPMTKKKKGPDDDDVPSMKANEFVLMVIMQEGK